MAETNIDPTLDAPKTADQLISSAIDAKASDIHLEPERDELIIRYRIDGTLFWTESVTNIIQDQLISRIKILSQLDISERRLPQDGHFEFTHNNRIYNIRVSTIPTTYGENIVLRIHNREDLLMKVEELGLEEDQLALLEKLIKGRGMIVITGPTGSGKTNLLYSILNSLNKADKGIMSLEDPVEYQMANIRQSEIDEDSGMTFARGLRSSLRQDPDIIMIGEIRDKETAELSIQAALTGILIFTTFHTFDLVALISRFNELGLAYSLLSEAIIGVISTRLVKKICPNCKVEYQITKEEKEFAGNYSLGPTVYKGQGCATCKNSGFLGRTGIFELVHFDKEVKLTILSHQESKLYDILAKKKFTTLRDAGLSKVRQGITTIDEVIRVVGI